MVFVTGLSYIKANCFPWPDLTCRSRALKHVFISPPINLKKNNTVSNRDCERSLPRKNNIYYYMRHLFERWLRMGLNSSVDRTKGTRYSAELGPSIQ